MDKTNNRKQFTRNIKYVLTICWAFVIKML